MYNDEQNLYHYTYRKDGTESGQRYDAKQPTVDEQLNSYRQQQEQQRLASKVKKALRYPLIVLSLALLVVLYKDGADQKLLMALAYLLT